GCRPGVCKWNRECYDTGYDTVDCNCRDLSASKKPKKEICMKDGDANVYYPNPIFFYNVLCQTSDDDCGYPENEADIHKARDFNYFGPCI
uniref:Uncharacterized protein n=1 Tax=Romanomermis culicivorax TaxID=13658 RepID=A0A915HVB0_ROMCU